MGNLTRESSQVCDACLGLEEQGVSLLLPRCTRAGNIIMASRLLHKYDAIENRVGVCHGLIFFFVSGILKTFVLSSSNH